MSACSTPLHVFMIGAPWLVDSCQFLTFIFSGIRTQPKKKDWIYDGHSKKLGQESLNLIQVKCKLKDTKTKYVLTYINTHTHTLIYVCMCQSINLVIYPYLPTPLLERDMTQGQFLSGV